MMEVTVKALNHVQIICTQFQSDHDSILAITTNNISLSSAVFGIHTAMHFRVK